MMNLCDFILARNNENFLDDVIICNYCIRMGYTSSKRTYKEWSCIAEWALFYNKADEDDE